MTDAAGPGKDPLDEGVGGSTEGGAEASRDTSEGPTQDPEIVEGSPAGNQQAPSPGAGARSNRSVVVAGLLSFLWPGLGHLVQGRRKAAALFGLPAIAFAAIAIWQVAQDPIEFGASLLDPGYVTAVVVAVFAFGLWRVMAVVHSMYPDLRPRTAGVGRRRFVRPGVALGLVAAIVVTHLAVGGEAWYIYQTSVDVQNNDWVADTFATPSPGGLEPTDDPNATPEPTPDDTPDAIPTATASPTGTVAPTPTSEPTQYVNPNRITFLLVGVDFTAGRRSTGSTDTLMVVSVDSQTRKAVMMSLPRDTASFPLYYGGTLASNFKINGLLASLYRGTTKSPDAPIPTLVKEIGFLVGIPINYYAIIDMDGFAQLVDAIGGIDVYNPRTIDDDTAMIHMSAGPVHLNGTMAIRYVRTREHGGSDYLRASRQQQVLVAIKGKAVGSSFNRVLSIASRMVQTDFPLKTAKNYVSLGRNLASIDNCVLGPPYSIHPDPKTTRGSWVSQLVMPKVANVSVYYFGRDSAYYGQPGVVPAKC